MKVSRVEEMRKADQDAVDVYDIPEVLLMENAGLAAYRVLEESLGGSVKEKTITVFCGIGNNGGDGLVTARKIHSNGGNPIVFILGDPEKYKNASAVNFGIIKKIPVKTVRVLKKESFLSETIHADAAVDGLLGTGLLREVTGLYKDAVEAMNKMKEKGKPVISLDIPSGINGNTGEVMGCAVTANQTVTFGLPKIGNLLYPGALYNGKLHVTHISFPPAIYAPEAMKTAVNIPPILPERSPYGHKGSFGKALFVAGAANYYGAPYFSAMAFLKAGGGYSRLAAPESMVPHLALKGGEIVFHPQKEADNKTLDLSAKKDILDIAEQSDVTVIGPGVSLVDETKRLMRALTAEIKGPLIIDGDGITAISEDLSYLKNRKWPTVLTPHWGEMTRLGSFDLEDIRKNPVYVLSKTVESTSAIIVLKGARTLIGFPDGSVWINMTGNSAMATAGSGDVLTGAVAAMKGLGLDLGSAVRAGVFVHGLSGDLAATAIGQDGVTASDILEYLPDAVKKYRERDYDPLGGIRIV